MSSGATHDRTALILCGIGVFLWGTAFGVKTAIVAVVAYLFGTFMLSPDLDLRNSQPSKRWGWFRFLWRPYSKTHAHRGISHNLLFGSAERVLYLVALALIATYAGYGFHSDFFADVRAFAYSYPHEMLTSFGGIWVANAVHIVQDNLT